MTISLSEFGVNVLILSFILIIVLLLVADLALGIGADRLWEWLKRRRTKNPRYPWSDRTGL